MRTGSARPVRLGLTGGIGSGKSTLGAMLGARGAAVADADQISRAVTAPGGAAIAPLRDAFGPGFIGSDGALDRERMRALAFSDAGAKQRLEAIVHPHVTAAIQEAARNAAAAGQRLIVFDIPLLVESGRWRRQLDVVAVVDCRRETQIARVQARSGLAPEAIEAIIDAQAPRAARRAAADFVVYNDGIPLTDLEAKAALIAAQFGL